MHENIKEKHMACFVAPTMTAIIATSIRKKIPSCYHIKWLTALLWGGVTWLIPEHIYHGEVVFYPPFFTAGFHEIIGEIVRVGIPMTLAAFAVWFSMLAVETYVKKAALKPRFASLMVFGTVLMTIVDKVLV